MSNTYLTVKVLKTKDGVPTSILLGGEQYALVPKDYINGHKSIVASRNKRRKEKKSK